MNRSSVWTLAATLVCVGVSCGQNNPLSSDARQDFKFVKDYVTRAAEKMPPENYDFKPAPEVRTFGQIIAHVADDQYNLCARAKGETRKASYTDIEDTVSGKPALLAALKQAFDYCDVAYESLTDANAAERLSFGKGKLTRLGQLNYNTWHTFDHYGNIVVYLRLKGLVPPSSERRK